MSLILLIIGIFLFYVGRIEIGAVRAQGRHVKAAGVILTLPAAFSLLMLNFIVPIISGNSYDAVATAVGLVTGIELIGMLAAVGIAYLLIADPPGAPHLPGILGELQNEARKQRKPTGANPAPRSPRTVTIPNPGIHIPVVRQDDFPSVMTLKEAARYLRKSEDDVLKLIEEGKLTAARDNFAYRIARSQLDELR